MRFIAWGGGVQSTTLAVMSALGDLPRVDAVIFADTGWEFSETYHFVAFYTEFLARHGLRVERVSAGNIKEDGISPYVHIPFWTSGGPLRRQCTNHFKIEPMARRIRELLSFHPTEPPHPPAGAAEVWLGISLDEYLRMKRSRVSYITNAYPLVMDKKMTRSDCKRYLQDHNLPIPPKSACVCCPYRSASDLLYIKSKSPEEFAALLEFDRSIRYLKPQGMDSGELYIWRGRRPLEEVNLEAIARRERRWKQLPLTATECESGFCWI
jgi:3'-phosphoadenosine 5'-phosphosulfate sulfotransferase (PAPS reductase)/FAD synthetase